MFPPAKGRTVPSTADATSPRWLAPISYVRNCTPCGVVGWCGLGGFCHG